MTLYASGPGWALHLGDALEVLRTLPDQSVDCCVTSPPYFGLRDYGVSGQIGAEASPAEFVAALVAVFAEVRRVLADDGTFWLNLGDTYYSGRGASTGTDKKNPARRFGVRAVDKAGAEWGTPKSLLMIPARVAIALCDAGWILRNDIIWAKPNGTPESVKDRLTVKHEHLFLFAKSRRYWFGLDDIREPHAAASLARSQRKRVAVDQSQKGVGAPNTFSPAQSVNPKGKNPGDVWVIPSRPFPGAHFATFPPALPARCITAGCRPGGTVLDPFAGVGTTGAAALSLGRQFVGVDLNPKTLALALTSRLSEAPVTVVP